jgi:4'-phosphopantetheinyl transferase
MQTIFFVYIRPLEPFVKGLSSLLRPERLDKMYRYHNPGDRLRCLAGGLLLEHIGRGQEIMVNEYGKPFLPGGPYFNLSHSGDFVCLAVSTSSPVGVDIEKQREEDFRALGKAVFHPDEQAFFLARPETEVFFDLWTAKESYAKMLGTGFSGEPSGFCILPGKTVFPPGKRPFLRNFNFIDGYSLALCATEPVQVNIGELFFL